MENAKIFKIKMKNPILILLIVNFICCKSKPKVETPAHQTNEFQVILKIDNKKITLNDDFSLFFLRYGDTLEIKTKNNKFNLENINIKYLYYDFVFVYKDINMKFEDFSHYYLKDSAYSFASSNLGIWTLEHYNAPFHEICESWLEQKNPGITNCLAYFNKLSFGEENSDARYYIKYYFFNPKFPIGNGIGPEAKLN